MCVHPRQAWKCYRFHNRCHFFWRQLTGLRKLYLFRWPDLQTVPGFIYYLLLNITHLFLFPISSFSQLIRFFLIFSRPKLLLKPLHLGYFLWCKPAEPSLISICAVVPNCKTQLHLEWENRQKILFFLWIYAVQSPNPSLNLSQTGYLSFLFA